MYVLSITITSSLFIDCSLMWCWGVCVCITEAAILVGASVSTRITQVGLVSLIRTKGEAILRYSFNDTLNTFYQWVYIGLANSFKRKQFSTSILD